MPSCHGSSCSPQAGDSRPTSCRDCTRNLPAQRPVQCQPPRLTLCGAALYGGVQRGGERGAWRVGACCSWGGTKFGDGALERGACTAMLISPRTVHPPLRESASHLAGQPCLASLNTLTSFHPESATLCPCLLPMLRWLAEGLLEDAMNLKRYGVVAIVASSRW